MRQQKNSQPNPKKMLLQGLYRDDTDPFSMLVKVTKVVFEIFVLTLAHFQL